MVISASFPDVFPPQERVELKLVNKSYQNIANPDRYVQYDAESADKWLTNLCPPSH